MIWQKQQVRNHMTCALFVNLRNWSQFFMRLSCYWSWISSSHCQRSCGSTRRQPSGSADYFDNVMTKFMINNRTDALNTDINLFFTITNCQIAGSSSLTRRMNFKSCVCPHIDNKNQPMSAREFLQLSQNSDCANLLTRAVVRIRQRKALASINFFVFIFIGGK